MSSFYPPIPITLTVKDLFIQNSGCSSMIFLICPLKSVQTLPTVSPILSSLTKPTVCKFPRFACKSITTSLVYLLLGQINLQFLFKTQQKASSQSRSYALVQLHVFSPSLPFIVPVKTISTVDLAQEFKFRSL